MNEAPRRIRVVLVEDSPYDAEVVVAELRRGGFDPEWERAETREEYLELLGRGADVIIADYSLPSFSAPDALDLLRERTEDTPFIVVTGTIGDEPAVQCLKKGAADYLLKDRLARLGSAVGQALEARALRAARRRAEHEIRSLARFPDENPSPVMRIAANGTIIYANRASGPVLAHWACRVGDPLPDPLRATAIRARAEGLTYECELAIGAQTVLSQFVPIEDADYLNLYLRDITDRVRAEAALRESERRLRLIADNVLDLFALVTLAGVFEYVSPSHEVTLGYPTSSLLGTSAYAFVHPDDLPRVHTEIKNAIARRLSHRFEYRYRHAAGHYVWLESVGKLLLDADGVPVGAVLSARDISERKRLQEAIEQHAAELERFNRLAVGRELRMIELKQQINSLSRELGRPEPYPLRDADATDQEGAALF